MSRCAGFAVLLCLNVLLCGCPPQNGGVPPRDAREAMARIESNYAKVRGALAASALVSARLRDADGRDHRFIAQSASLAYEKPRCLYFDIKNTLGGSVARIGSNAERYWMWVDVPEARRLWWGSWRAMEEGAARRMAIPPDQLLDVLLLAAPPDAVGGGLHPLLEIRGHEQRLLFLALDEDGWPYAQREMTLDPRPPYLPLRIVDFDATGGVRLDAELGGYAPLDEAGADAPHVPRRYVVRWPVEQSELRVDLQRVRYRTNELPFCEFPKSWNGEVESLDE